MKSYRFFLILSLLVITSLACRAIIPEEATSTPQLAQPTRTKFPTQAALPTIEPSETEPQAASATETSPPTEEPKTTEPPAPTPTPRGFYRHADAGFSLIYPTNWFLDEEGDDFVRVLDRQSGLTFVAVGSPASANDSLDEIIAQFKDTLFKDLDVEVSPTFSVPLADGLSAEAADLSVSQGGTQLVYRLAYIQESGRTYLLLAIGGPIVVQRNQSTLEQIYASVQLFTPALYGVEGGNNLVLLNYGDPDGKDLDPATTTTSADDYVGLLFSGLVRLGPDLKIYPDLAESWKVSPDGTVYTFVLRQGLKFADGAALTTDDVIWSWERLATPSMRSTTAATYMGDILGLKDRLAGKAQTIAGLKAVDEQTLQVTLDGPKPYFLAKLSYPTSFILDKDTTKNNPDDWVWQANASGPYRLKEYKETKAIILERNPNYHTLPAIETVTFLLDPGGSPISRYEDGTLDILYLDGTTAERVRREDDPLHNEWQSTPSLCTTAIQMNNSIPPFDDPLVRKAFSLALDRDAYVERLTNNTNIPALTILPPSMPGFSADLAALSYDPTAAKAALQASSYAGKLPKISLEASGFGTVGRDDVNLLVETWRQALGVEVEVIYLEPNNFTREAKAEKGQMTLYGWCADYPDPQNFLDVLYHTDSEFNVSGYSNSKVDELLARANVEGDPARRIQLYQQVEKMLLEDFAFIPISHDVADVLVKPRVQGFVLSPMHAAYVPWLSLKP